MAQEETVKWFSEEKGYGFISPDDGGEDLFIHYYSDIEGRGFRSLQEGQRVVYELAPRVARGRGRSTSASANRPAPVQTARRPRRLR